MATTATQDPTGSIAGVFHGPMYPQAPQRPGPLPSRVLHPDEQLQRSQPFYVPAVQPFFPYQWSMSSPYVPYGGFPGLGYGMMPSLLFPQCLEVPGYMIPQTPLHMLDYRRMNPHVAATIAHQTRHSRFQNGVPPGRVMVSSEVQTEPLCHNIDSHERAASHNCSESGRGTGSPVSTSPSSLDNKSVVCPEGTSMLTQNYNATNAIDATDLSAVPKSEILQTEQMQMKCREMPSDLNFQIKDNMELASHNETDLLQCSLGSVQSSGDVVLCSYQSLAFRKDKQRVEAGMLRYSRKHCLPARTEVSVVRTPPSCRTFKTYPKPSRSDVTQSINSEMPFQAKSREDGNSSNNMDFKILRLPFDIQNHNQPCQLEASIWSVESLIPYVPSTEWMTENGLLTPQKPLSPLSKHSDISKRNYVPEGKNPQTGASAKYHGHSCQLEASIWSVESLIPYVPSTEWMTENGLLTPPRPLLSPLNEHGDLISKSNYVPEGKNLQPGGSAKCHGHSRQLEASIWSVDSLTPYVPSNEWMVENGFLTPQKPLTPQIKSSGVLSTQNRRIGKSSTGILTRIQTCASSNHCSFNSLESHSPYRPSTSWLADFGNVYYCSKFPVVRQQPDLPEKRLSKISLQSSPLRNGHYENTMNQRPAIAVSDQKHCSFHTCKCKAKSSSRLAGSAKKCGLVSRSTLENKLPFSPSCRHDIQEKDQRKLSFSDGFGCKREETTKVKTFYMKRATEAIHGTPKMTLGSHLAKCANYQAKLSEQTGLCEDCQCRNPSPAQDKCGDLGLRMWEKHEEDCTNTPKQRLLQRLQKDSAWKASMQVSTTERRIQKKINEYSLEITQEEDTMFMATSGRCAHPVESEKAY
ncbi:hypothetical protein Q8A67_020760 [Cirrhinus molitorella]|uniref:Uncharacterized protein n=1 Tax=Cirrhinus molitorella TaxID=172907 RepID=A0AA88TEA1_9TELE|nr:hypothetical protein Q8A67_020760 [Cirrhinus molitorella]